MLRSSIRVVSESSTTRIGSRRAGSAGAGAAAAEPQGLRDQPLRVEHQPRVAVQVHRHPADHRARPGPARAAGGPPAWTCRPAGRPRPRPASPSAATTTGDAPGPPPSGTAVPAYERAGQRQEGHGLAVVRHLPGDGRGRGLLGQQPYAGAHRVERHSRDRPGGLHDQPVQRQQRQRQDQLDGGAPPGLGAHRRRPRRAGRRRRGPRPARCPARPPRSPWGRC